MDWDQTIKQFEQYLRLERSLSDHTIAAYLNDVEKLRQFLRPLNTQPTQVSIDHLREFLQSIVELGILPRTQARIISGIKSYFKYLVFEDLMDHDPSVLIEAPRLGRKLPDTLSYSEIEKMLATIDHSTPEGARSRAIIETLYSSGLRVSELTGLKLGDVHADVGFLRVLGKGDKERLVPIGSSALKYLAIYIDQVRNHIRIQSGHEAYVFLNRRGGRLSRVTVFNLVKELAQAAGLNKNVSPHTFRHSFATHLIEGGADLRAVQQMLGHESITTTEIYTHLDRDYLKQTITDFHPRS